MEKFNFKYDTVKRVHKIKETQAHKEFTEIENRIRDTEQEAQILLEEIDSIKNASSGRKKVEDLMKEQNYKDFLLDSLNKVYKNIEELNRQRILKFNQLQEKVKESKVLEKLEEKLHEEYVLEQGKTELKDFDEIALMKFTRNS